MVLRTGKKVTVLDLRAYPWGASVPQGPEPVHTSDMWSFLSAELFPVAKAVAVSNLAHKPFSLITQAPLGKQPPL